MTTLVELLKTATPATVQLQSHPFFASVHVDDNGAIGIIYRRSMENDWHADTLGKVSQHESQEAAIQAIIDRNREYLAP